MRASAIWPTAAAAWLSSSFSAPRGSFEHAAAERDRRPTTRPARRRSSRCSSAMSSASAASQASLQPTACCGSTSSEEPTLTTMRRKSARAGGFCGTWLRPARRGLVPRRRFIRYVRGLAKGTVGGRLSLVAPGFNARSRKARPQQRISTDRDVRRSKVCCRACCFAAPAENSCHCIFYAENNLLKIRRSVMRLPRRHVLHLAAGAAALPAASRHCTCARPIRRGRCG